MDANSVIVALECSGMPVILHVKSGNKYRMNGISKVKLLGEWHLVASYSNEKEMFGRCIDDFGGFEYLHNEAIS